MALDGDAPFPFQIHIVEHLPFRHLYGVGILKQSVGDGRLTVVNVGDDAEISNILHRQ